MAKKRTAQLFYAQTAGTKPASLARGELFIDAMSNPPVVLTGVPTSRDPSGLVDLLADIAALKARVAVLEDDMRYTGWRSRMPPEPLSAPIAPGPQHAPEPPALRSANVRSAAPAASAAAANVSSDAPLQSSSVAGSTVGVTVRKKPRARAKPKPKNRGKK